MTYDLVVVGAGPAGLAVAIEARLVGLQVCVLEARLPPLDKACGEGIMPAGVEALACLGVDIPLQRQAPFAGIRYIDGAVVAEGKLPSPGLGIRRTVLSDAMICRARALGAELHFGARVQTCKQHRSSVTAYTHDRTFVANTLIAADGLHSRLRRQLGLAHQRVHTARYGVRTHYAVAPWAPFVEVHWHDEAEAYVTPVDPSCVGLALLWHGRGRLYDDLLALFPQLQARLSGAKRVSSVRGAGPFAQSVRRRVVGNVALVGDAAGYVDAISGEGISLALNSARALVRAFVAGRLQEYESSYAKLARTYYRLTSALVWLSRHRRVRHQVVQLLAHRPALFDGVLRTAVGPQSS